MIDVKHKKSKSPPAKSIDKGSLTSQYSSIIANNYLFAIPINPNPNENDGISLKNQINTFIALLVDSIKRKIKIKTTKIPPFLI